jgi:hypothetical protein
MLLYYNSLAVLVLLAKVAGGRQSLGFKYAAQHSLWKEHG